MSSLPYGVPPLNEKENRLVQKINREWDKAQALSNLRGALQTAVEVELATIPIYLYAYYSIQRTVGDTTQPTGFPHSPLSRFADKAGALIMSVAVEEMLHMSLTSNILYALGQMPILFQNSPTYPAKLPGHSGTGPDGGRATIDLAPFSEERLRQFLLIEYPAPADAEPEGKNWKTIGQIYSYIRCIISSQWITDRDFSGTRAYQIQSGNYSPNNIDTIYPDRDFNKNTPVPADQPGSASEVAKYASREDSYVGSAQLIQISSCQEAMEAIATICFQGEGFDQTVFDDPTHGEYSHYWKFLQVQACLSGYSPSGPDIAPLPPPPTPVPPGWTDSDLDSVVFKFPVNPTTALPVPPQNTGYTDPFDRDIADLCSALYTYMLIMSETLFKVPDPQQKLFFNRTLHMSMIWLLDKFCQAMRTVFVNTKQTNPQPDAALRLAPTFQNYPFSSRTSAYGEMIALGQSIQVKYMTDPRYSAVGWLVNMIAGTTTPSATKPVLPDVAQYWQDCLGAPQCFPKNPPATLAQPGAVRHACMGLNHCMNQGRTQQNACAGQGYCSTALLFNPDENQPGIARDHQCHVQNDCRSQGGCGLYGTSAEQNEPGVNDCRSMGSCATPINAERFSTDGCNRGKSVWVRARETFTTDVWPGLRAKNPELPPTPPQVPGAPDNPDLFKYGPTIEWITASGQGMTACGASGMSGAGSCA